MQINLDREEVRKILCEKFGEASFLVCYTETDAEWEGKNRMKISELEVPPKKDYQYLHF
jgi:hypothetical protein